MTGFMNPGDLNLPTKFKAWEDGQWEAIQAADSFLSAGGQRQFFLEAPPGTGKTVIGVGTWKLQTVEDVLTRMRDDDVLATLRNFRPNCVFVTKTHQLQEQLLKEFPIARTLMGRKNYPCALAPNSRHMTADECVWKNFKESTGTPTHLGDIKWSKKECQERCFYTKAKKEALRAEVAVLNTAYFLNEVNGPGIFRNPRLLVYDEADSLDSDLMSFVEFTISSRVLKDFQIPMPKPPLSAISVWARDWPGEATDRLEDVIGAYKAEVRSFEAKDLLAGYNVQSLRKLDQAQRLYEKIRQFTVDVHEDSWVVVEETHKKDPSQHTWHFKPVRVAPYARKYFWDWTEQTLGMSGTFLDMVAFAKDVGLRSLNQADTGRWRTKDSILPDTWGFSVMPCPFPVERRPIYYRPVTNVTAGTTGIGGPAVPKLAEAIKTIMNRWPDERILVHTVSYPLCEKLVKELGADERIMYHDSLNRKEMLEQFKGPLAFNKVMLSPSFDRGVDLPDDLCRCIVVAKVPWLNRGDDQIKLRAEQPDGPAWYNLKTAQTLIQMTGRGMRHKNDYCESIILDAQYSRLKALAGTLLPSWWTDSVHYITGFNELPERWHE